jgi:hypothetical protein
MLIEFLMWDSWNSCGLLTSRRNLSFIVFMIEGRFYKY